MALRSATNTVKDLRIPELTYKEKLMLVANIRAGSDILRELFLDENVRIRLGAALNPNSSAETLATLSKDAHYAVRAAVAYNPRADKDTLAWPAKDKYAFVVLGVARNRNTPPEVLSQLFSTSDNIEIRIELARNAHTPKRA